MQKLCIILLADRSTHENLGRALHALLYAAQAKEKGVEVEVIFDGGGVEWPVEMGKKDNHLHALYQQLLEQEVIKGVCSFCAGAFKVEDELKTLGAQFIDDDSGHPNIGAKIADGWQVLTL